MAQLPSFLPSLFEAFGNQSADVRKVLGSLTFFEIFGHNFLTVKEQCDVCICSISNLFANQKSDV